MCKEGWGMVHAHLLVVQGQAEQAASPTVMPQPNGSSSGSLAHTELLDLAF